MSLVNPALSTHCKCQHEDYSHQLHLKFNFYTIAYQSKISYNTPTTPISPNWSFLSSSISFEVQWSPRIFRRQLPHLRYKYQCSPATSELRNWTHQSDRNAPGLSLFSTSRNSYERPLPVSLLVANSQPLNALETDALSGAFVAMRFLECEEIERSEHTPSPTYLNFYFLQVLRIRDSFSSHPSCWIDSSSLFSSFELRAIGNYLING